MNRQVSQRRAALLFCALFSLLWAVLLPLPVFAADRNLPNVQFTTGKYGQNCLTAANWETSGKTLNLTQNVYLDAAARQRADQGELTMTASVRVGANGSRTNTRKLEVKFFDQNGNQVGSTQKAESDSYSVSHHWNTLTLADRSVPKGTARIQYYVYNHIGTSGDLEIQNCSLIVKDTASPRLVNITAGTNDSRSWNLPHPAGTQVTYTLHFSERVTANVDLAQGKGAPRIDPVSPGVTTGGIQPANGGASSTLSYTYTIPQNGDVISDSHTIALLGISAFSITDDAGNTASVSLSEQDVKNLNSSLGAGGSLRMDNRPPELTGITSEGFSKDTVLKAGDTIKLHLKFHEIISVPGTAPSITLSNGKTAVYLPTGTTTDLASFSYTVEDGDDVHGLAIAAFDLDGIVDAVGQRSTDSPRYAAFTASHQGYLDVYGVAIDTTAPTALLPRFSEGWLGRNTPVEATVSDRTESGMAGSGVKLVRYAWSQSEEVPGTFTDLMDPGSETYPIPAPAASGSWYLWIVSEDHVGNQSEPVCSSTAARFDVTPPEITLTKTEQGNVVLRVVPAFSDSESGVARREYRWYDAEDRLVAQGILEEDLPYPVLDGVYRLELCAADAAGNEAVCVQTIHVDTSRPEVSITRGADGYRRSHLLSVQCQDAVSGVDRVEFQWKPGTEPAEEKDWQRTEERSFSSPQGENGMWQLYIRATDAAGNQTVTSEQCLLDNMAPAITITPDGNAGIMGLPSYSILITAEDPEQMTPQGRLKIAYRLSESQDLSAAGEWTQAGDPTDLTVEITLPSDRYLHVKAEDEAGNVGTKCSQLFAVDQQAPVGTIRLADPWQAVTNCSSGNILLQAADDYDDPSDLQMAISVDGAERPWAAFAQTAAVSFAKTEGEHTISVRFRDTAGNISEPVSVTLVYDSTPPVITLSYAPAGRTRDDVTVTASLSDGEWITGSSHTFSANGEFTFQAKDAAGNLGSETAEVTWIDRTAPDFTLTSAQADSAPHKTASFTAASDAEDLAALFYRICPRDGAAGPWQPLSGATQTLPELPDGVYEIQVCAEDDLGNRSESRSLTVWLDNTPPRASVSYLPASRTSENVTATLSVQDDSAVSVTNPADGSTTHVFTDNGTFTFRFTDAAGNSGSLEARVDWIDRSLPALETVITDPSGETTLASGQWTNHPVRVALMLTHAAQQYDSLTFNGQDVMGEQIHSVEGIEPVPNEANTYLVSTYGVLEYQITDRETQLTSHGSVLLAVDTTAPVCGEEGITCSTRSWTNQDVTVRVQAVDDLSQSVTYLRLDGEEYREDPAADSHVFAENGEHVFYFRDAAGNIGSRSVTVDWIDKVPPQAQVHYTTEDGQPYDPADWTNQSVTARLTFQSASPVTMPEGTDRYVFSANGSHEFTYTDAAGNRNSTTVVIDRIDRVAPTGYLTASSNGWTNRNVTVTLHAFDEASGAENMTHLFTENGTHTFVLKDRAGNETRYAYVMDRIDKQPPQIEVVYTPDSVTRTPFPVYACARADERVFWESDCSSWRFAENGSHVFAATDRAGNRAEVTARVDWISPDLPEVQLHYSATETTREDVTAELRCTDENASIRVLNNGGSRFFTFRENGRFTFRYTDMAGKNTGTITAVVTCIDKTGPTLTAQMSRTELGAEPVTVTVTADEPVTWPNGMQVLDPQTAAVTFAENTAVQLWAEDALGNRGIARLDIQCIDAVPPVISMESPEVCIPLGQSFDPYEGVTVEDLHPSPEPLTVAGRVDTRTVGTYPLTYTAVDAVGNRSTARRTVTVYDPDAFHVQINNQLSLGQTIVVSPGGSQFTLINAEGEVSVKLLPGRVPLGDFKTGGTQIAAALLDGSYQFPNFGYVTLLVQDQERHTKQIELFVAR